MKTFIVGATLIILLSIGMIFMQDNDEYMLTQERYKAVADAAADAAALYYDQEKFAEGIKVFNKSSGNEAALDIISQGLHLDDSLEGGISGYALGTHDYYVYYFDGDGTLSGYKNGNLIKTEGITFPYTFTESLTGYTKQIDKPSVIVTIDKGTFDYRINAITDPKLVRTSEYEYVSY